MDTIQPPSPLLPDLVSSPSNIPPPIYDHSPKPNCFQKQQVQSLNTNCHEGSNSGLHMMTTSNMMSSDDTVVQLMMDCSMETSNGCSSGIHSNSISTWPPATPSSSSSTTFNEYPPQQYPLPPPPPSPPQRPVQMRQMIQPPQLPDIVPGKVVEEFEKIMSNENDRVVLTNSICLLFRFSIDSVRGLEVCQAMSASPAIMNQLYHVLTHEQFQNDDLILCYATGNLTNISKYEEGRAAILGCVANQMTHHFSYELSPGVPSLIRSLQSRDSNVVIFAITAIHNLLLDRRIDIQELAKEQIKNGIKHIVRLLDNQCLMHNYEFKVIVLDCLQILAYGNRDNRLKIRESRGPYLLLRTIQENDNQPTEELIETASRVLKSLSACPENKIDIIENGGISVLTNCIRKNNYEILKTCLWTLRNLSDVINKSQRDHNLYIEQLVERLLMILKEYYDEPCIITCALGILANITCNNEIIKQFICTHDGVRLLIETISRALRDNRDLFTVDKEILEPAICALCHLMNQTHNPNLAEDAKASVRHFELLKQLMYPCRSDELSKVVEKLKNLSYNTI